MAVTVTGRRAIAFSNSKTLSVNIIVQGQVHLGSNSQRDVPVMPGCPV